MHRALEWSNDTFRKYHSSGDREMGGIFQFLEVRVSCLLQSPGISSVDSARILRCIHELLPRPHKLVKQAGQLI
jgi:hypothetical protein